MLWPPLQRPSNPGFFPAIMIFFSAPGFPDRMRLLSLPAMNHPRSIFLGIIESFGSDLPDGQTPSAQPIG